jgi:hypothetical protein
MSELQVRFPVAAAEKIDSELRHQTVAREPVVFALVSAATTATSRLILVREVVVPPEDAFLPSAGHGARWKGSYTVELLNRALETQLGLLILHSHGQTYPVSMSADDRQSALMLLPKFQQVLPTRPHGSIVFGHDSAAGLLLMPGQTTPESSFSCRTFGSSIVTVPRPGTVDERQLHARQPVTVNPAVERLFADTTVAVVGLSGGGTQVVPQLAALGIGRIIGIDPQRVAKSNRYSTSRVGWLDILLRRRKTDIMKSVARSLNRNIKFTGVVGSVPDQKAVAAIKSADIVVGCVNNLHARSDLMELCWRYCIPYVDIGLGVNVKEAWTGSGPAPMTGINGNVFVAIPGGPCMWCTNFLTQNKLDAETDGRGRSYLRGGSDGDAWVLSFNGVLASQAVSEVAQLLLGYAPTSDLRTYKVFDGLEGSMVECLTKSLHTCEVCGTILAAGDVLWT